MILLNTKIGLGAVTAILYIIFVVIQIMMYRKLDFKVILKISFPYFMGYVVATLDLIPNCADGMVKVLSQVIKKESNKTKLLFDCRK